MSPLRAAYPNFAPMNKRFSILPTPGPVLQYNPEVVSAVRGSTQTFFVTTKKTLRKSV